MNKRVCGFWDRTYYFAVDFSQIVDSPNICDAS